MTARDKIERIRTGKPVTLGDFMFIFLLVCAVGVSLYCLYRPSPAAELRAVVRIDGKIYGSYPLDTDRTENIDGKLTLVIENGTAFVKDPVCSDKACTRLGKITHVHETIVCAPEGIVIRITGYSEIHAGAR